LSAKSVAASWLLYVFHADTVTSAAWIGGLQSMCRARRRWLPARRLR